jgi:cytochrome c oxidase assembly protein subunit 15
VAIVVTGAGVRLTGSGLGCTDWPRCTDTTFTPSSDLHARIEFANRLITGLVSAAVAAAVLGSLRLRPRRRDLVWLSWGLVAGVVGQIVLGGLVVLSHLNPWLVQGHFVLSMVLVGNAMVLRHRAGRPAGHRSRPTVTPALARWGWAVVGLAVVVLLTGTLVTGSGPHSGHQEAEPGAGLDAQLEAAREVQRLPLAVHDAARFHGLTMIVFLGAVVWVLVQLRRHHHGHETPPGRLMALRSSCCRGPQAPLPEATDAGGHPHPRGVAGVGGRPAPPAGDDRPQPDRPDRGTGVQRLRSGRIRA